jgi:hypothetical protein
MSHSDLSVIHNTSQDIINIINDGRYEGLPVFEGTESDMTSFPLPPNIPRTMNISEDVQEAAVQSLLENVMRHFSDG